ncbi:MAG: type II toxin-antitoxin system VapC family toxin [Candidatus Dojkabacteria bacterium]|nr:MAG: type II toxin-antitoxin system VapC family toxin [Candidatus Dojkabacteria bacterium]
MTKYILDSSFLYALFVPDDILHRKAHEIYAQLLEEELPLHVPFNALVELYASGEDYPFSKFVDEIAEELEFSEAKDIAFIKTLPSRTRRSLKANDCMILAIAKRKKSQLVTFDRKLKNAAKKYLS